MLVLTRQTGERVLVGDAIVVVLEIRSHQVRLGFEAPDGLRIVRAELLRRLAIEPVRNRHLR